jgi:eukaryotic-like serine/threonine-protein kinase
MSPPLGERLGPYEIVAPIGRGGMGVVYRARDPRLDRQVAIKVLHAETSADTQARERFRREAMAIAALDHPYICKIFEIGEEEKTLYLVMELVGGDTLHQRLRSGPLPMPEALRVAGEIAEALHEAHAGGFLHRDLKPSNIMLSAQGHVKVMDFGLSKRLEPVASPDATTLDAGEAPLTRDGAIVGTPDYMSPEQLKGRRLDARSDLFSFGVMLAEMTSGTHPFRGASTMETISAVVSEPPSLGANVPDGVSAVVRRLLSKEVEKRHASAAEVRDELARLMVPSGSITPPPAAVAAHGGRKPRAGAALAAGAAVLASAAAVWLLRRPPPADAGAAPPAAIRSIAVLPLDNYSGDPAQDYFAEGMTDELTSDLARISRLRVISRGSAMQFNGKSRPPTREIAKILGVDAVVEGSVIRAGDRVRITAQLIDAKADRHLWAKSFERSSRDVLALQEELAAAIANEIHVQLTPAEKSRLSSARQVVPEAYDAYLKGRYFFNRPSDENLQKAIAHFEEAVKRSPDFAPAYSGLSDAYLWAGYNEGFITASAARPKAKETAEKAIALDDQSAEAHASLATYKLFYEYDWAGMEREFRRAISLNPGYAFAHDQFGLGLAFLGRNEESIAEGKRAAELDPLSPQILVDACMGYMNKGDFSSAKALARRAAELDPSYFFPPFIEGWADLGAGKPAEALPALAKARALGAPAFVTAFLYSAHGAAGDRARALQGIEALKKISLGGEVSPFNLAMVHLGLGDRARAIDALERAYATDSQWMGWLYRDPLFASLREEPRFKALVKKLAFAG